MTKAPAVRFSFRTAGVMYEYLWMQGELLHSVKNPLFERAINRQSRSEVQKAADNDPHRRGRSARIYRDLKDSNDGPRQSGTGRHSKAEIFLASCGDFLFVYSGMKMFTEILIRLYLRAFYNSNQFPARRAERLSVYRARRLKGQCFRMKAPWRTTRNRSPPVRSLSEDTR